jgi:hypothetical protein
MAGPRHPSWERIRLRTEMTGSDGTYFDLITENILFCFKNFDHLAEKTAAHSLFVDCQVTL